MAKRSRLWKVARSFPQNGIKLLLENPKNVRELFRVVEFRQTDQIVFSDMKVERTTFVAPNFRHIEADIVLTAPFRIGGSATSERRITLYVLIEHQSEPDRFIVFRVLEYVVQIYKSQYREWIQRHESNRGFVFQPVLPIVFYTGTRSWERLPAFAELTDAYAALEPVLPAIRPLFLNLNAIAESQLKLTETPFGCVLEVLRTREAPTAEFQQTVAEATRELGKIARREHERWLDLMSYLMAIVYHYREAAEQPQLFELLHQTAQRELRKEVKAMQQSLAQVHAEEAQLGALRATLLLQLEEKFGAISEALLRHVATEDDPVQLMKWLQKIIKAKRLKDVGIPIS